MKDHVMIVEKPYQPTPGWVPLLILLGLLVSGPALLIHQATMYHGDPPAWKILYLIVSFLAAIIGMIGFIAVQPNDSRVLLLFGNYQGTVKESGFWWVNPFFTKTKVSLRVRNFETGAQVRQEQKDPTTGKVLVPKGHTAGRPSKVNDRDGNPIEISAVVVWRVVDTAEAMFEVDDYEDYVRVQSEAALRILASRHPYDSEDHEVSLRGSTTEISDQLQKDIQERLHKAGVEVIEARISHLAYAQEIAAAMLQRQQASAVVAARSRIVEGAVGMVEMALDELKEKSILDLDDEKRAQMVANLLVVLCSDRHTQPVVNTGSLY